VAGSDWAEPGPIGRVWIEGGTSDSMFSPRGAGSDVLVGVRVGRNCMFGCGAVMASAIPPSVVADGSRERVLRRLGKIE
jgi:hypothetical protein